MKKSGNSDELIATIDNSAEISQIEKLAPEREKIKSDIFDNIKTKLNGPKSNKTFAPNYGNYYFVLSKKITVVNGNTATITYQFIYIENYGTSSAVTWQGSIIYTYTKQTSPIIRWVLTNISVEFGQVNSGTITGIVKNKITNEIMQNVNIYAKADEEQTVAVKTGENGTFTIPDVLPNTYTVFAMFNEFDIGKAENIVITSGNTIDVGIIYLIPSEDTRFATIQGYVYYDQIKSRPVSGAAIRITDKGAPTDLLTATTDELGKYEIPFVSSGQYEIFVRKENLYNEVGMPIEITLEQLKTSNIVNVDDIILENNFPIITPLNPLTTPYIALGGATINFEVTATDIDNDLLYYEWSATDGDLGFSIDKKVDWIAPTIPGVYNIICKVYDKKGGYDSFTWEIIVNEISTGWIQKTTNANFPKRRAHSSVVFNNKMWIIGGGQITGSLNNDVYYSNNGSNWTLATDNPGFPARHDHKTVVFNNKIWLIGGKGLNNFKNDVWNSNDGIIWNEVTHHAPFVERSSHACLVFNGKMWVIGGNHDGTNLRKDVWSTIDGITWIQETNNAAFGKRSRFSSLVFTDPLDGIEKMWVVGGNGESGELADSVYKSIDGITWIQVTTSAAFGKRSGHTSLVFNNKMWVIGGRDKDTGNSTNNTWYSIDGINWIEEDNTMSKFNPKRTLHTSVVYNNKMWIFAGSNNPNGTEYNDVWFHE